MRRTLVKSLRASAAKEHAVIRQQPAKHRPLPSTAVRVEGKVRPTSRAVPRATPATQPAADRKLPNKMTNNSKEVLAANSRTTKQQETPRALSPKRKRQGQGRNLTEADIPRLVDAFVRAQRRQTTPKSDEEGYTDEEYASDSSEAPLTDELSSKEIIYIYIYIYRHRGMHGDLSYVTVVYVNVVMYCSSRYVSLDGLSSTCEKWVTPSPSPSQPLITK